jgi:hypothetical protein
MGTITAQILVGGEHPNDGGISPEYSMCLFEGSRAAWKLKKEGELTREIVWIPTVEHMLEDAILMIALYVERDEQLVVLVESKLGQKLPNRLEMYDALDEQTRTDLYEKCREISFKYKWILTAITGSHILHQLSSLKQYHAQMEVCVPIYTRLRSVWDSSEQYQVKGTLNIEK